MEYGQRSENGIGSAKGTRSLVLPNPLVWPDPDVWFVCLDAIRCRRQVPILGMVCY